MQKKIRMVGFLRGRPLSFCTKCRFFAYRIANLGACQPQKVDDCPPTPPILGDFFLIWRKILFIFYYSKLSKLVDSEIFLCYNSKYIFSLIIKNALYRNVGKGEP